MTIIDQIKVQYPDQADALLADANKVYAYLSQQPWWVLPWKQVVSNEGGKRAVFISIMLSVIECKFDYHAGFLAYRNRLVQEYGNGHLRNSSASLDRIFDGDVHGNAITGYDLWEKGISPTQDFSWDDPTAEAALSKDNTSAENHRSAGPAPGRAAPLGSGNKFPFEGLSPSEGVTPSEGVCSELVNSARLDALTDDEREALEVYQRCGRSYKQAAPLLGLTLNKTKVLVARAKRRASRPTDDPAYFARLGMHRRWHKEKKNGDCIFCQKESNGNANGS